jgi:hypothetical protein
MIIGIVLYNRFATTWQFRKIFTCGQVCLVLLLLVVLLL